ncbi:GH1 family beta-glucosidase [Hydrotalea sp.]|uniref:GH1 family beta-glucosidase n=1 Tax=Hydrotalea sp. TaxID=2881279 RepID=UPI002612E064|nr:GH1 family beta-glucosidase [Hydrotalea sp.]
MTTPAIFKADDFGSDFLWGIAIAAAQNEGAYNLNGRGLSIWDQFSLRGGKIKGNAKPDVCCDFYHRYKTDLLLVKQLGFKVFRFSIAWSRIMPNGTGLVNKAGILFYHQVIDECLALGLIPSITLYHWDLPLALQKEGGWTSHLLLKWFSKYVILCMQEYGNKVKHWIVLNEPMGFTSLGYMLGKHAPGKSGIKQFFAAIHNAAMAQAEGGRIIRAMVPDAIIGTTFSCSEVVPATNKKEDILAAKRIDILMNRLFIEPVLGMGYPSDNSILMDRLHLFTKAWKYTERMQFDFDFIGLQNYFPVTVAHNAMIPYVQAVEVKATKRKVPHTDLGWEISPTSFYHILKQFASYPNVKSIIVTENGACFKDKLQKGAIHDVQRIDYFKSYLNALLQAKKDGMPINGYFVWTLTDNFEWSEGFQAPFGLVHVDFETQQRTIKQSGYWWQQFLMNIKE